MVEDSANTSIQKAKKARKPFVWTPENRARFENMVAKRKESLALKKKAKEEGKLSLEEEKRNVSKILKLKEEMKKILQVLETKNETIPVEIKEVIKAEDEKPKLKPKAIVRKIEPEPEPEFNEEEDEEEELPPPPPKKYQPPKQNLYRYTSQNTGYGIPNPPVERKPTPAPMMPQLPKKPQFTFL